MYSETENADSDATEVAGMIRYFFAKVPRISREVFDQINPIYQAFPQNISVQN
jgi:hypothetical protein